MFTRNIAFIFTLIILFVDFHFQVRKITVTPQIYSWLKLLNFCIIVVPAFGITVSFPEGSIYVIKNSPASLNQGILFELFSIFSSFSEIALFFLWSSNFDFHHLVLAVDIDSATKSFFLSEIVISWVVVSVTSYSIFVWI
jgi:hypothetical protein